MPAKPLRVCLLNEYFFPDIMGGTPKHMSDLARDLADNQGFEVQVITSNNSYRDPEAKFADFEDWDGIKIHRVAAPNWLRKRTIVRLFGNLLFAMRAGKALKTKVDCDVVLVSTAPVTLPMAAMLGSKPYVYLIYDLDPDRAEAIGVVEKGSRPATMLRTNQRKWLGGAKSVIAIGRCMKQYLVKTYGLPASQVEVVEVGANDKTVTPLPRETQFRAKNNIDSFILLYTGNFGKYHDFDSILDLAVRLEKDSIDAKIVLVGSGAKKDHLLQRIEAENMKNVLMLPFVPEEEYSDLLASADMCLVTLEDGMEGLCVPSKFYSILAAGRPTFAVMRPETEVAYTIKEAECGVVVDLGDVDGMYDQIVNLQGQRALLDKMGSNARRIFEEKYTTSRLAAKYADILQAAHS